jgi:hypothetical protein
MGTFQQLVFANKRHKRTGPKINLEDFKNVSRLKEHLKFKFLAGNCQGTLGDQFLDQNAICIFGIKCFSFI